MKFFLLLLIFTVFSGRASGMDITDAEWCRKNGGTVEFDFQYNITFNCMARDIKNIPHIKKVYNIICTPYTSSILENTPPLFLKVVTDIENKNKTIFDEYNWKITGDELVKYI